MPLTFNIRTTASSSFFFTWMSSFKTSTAINYAISIALVNVLSNGLVPEKKIPYYAHWVSKFLDELRSQTNTADWQIIQAEEALVLYSEHFLKGDTSVLSPNMPQGGEKLPDLPQALDEMRQAIRIKHYSYSTERSYLDWVKRFYDYTLNIKKKDVAVLGLSSADVKDYLGYLALHE